MITSRCCFYYIQIFINDPFEFNTVYCYQIITPNNQQRFEFFSRAILRTSVMVPGAALVVICTIFIIIEKFNSTCNSKVAKRATKTASTQR